MTTNSKYTVYGYIAFGPLESGFVTPVFSSNDKLYLEVASNDKIDGFEILSLHDETYVIKGVNLHEQYEPGDDCCYAFKWNESVFYGSRENLVEKLKEVLLAVNIQEYIQESVLGFIEEYLTLTEFTSATVGEVGQGVVSVKNILHYLEQSAATKFPQVSTEQRVSGNPTKQVIGDLAFIQGLTGNEQQRMHYENELYLQYAYLIHEGGRKYHLSYDDSVSIYNNATVTVIHNIIHGSFDRRCSIKTYLFQIFSNMCIDLTGKKMGIAEKVYPVLKVYKASMEPESFDHLPDSMKVIIHKLIEQQKLLAVKRHLQTIGEKCKEMLLLFEQGYTDKEIAEQLKYNSAVVAKTTRLRCLEELKEKMKHLFKQ